MSRPLGSHAIRLASGVSLEGLCTKESIALMQSLFQCLTFSSLERSRAHDLTGANAFSSESLQVSKASTGNGRVDAEHLVPLHKGRRGPPIYLV